MFKTIIDKILGKEISKKVNPGGNQVKEMMSQIIDGFYKENYEAFVDALAYNLQQRTSLSRNEMTKICHNSFTQKFIDTYEYTIFYNAARLGWEIKYSNNKQDIKKTSDFIDNTTMQLLNEAMRIYNSEDIVGAYASTNIFVYDMGKKFGSTRIPEYFLVKGRK